MSQAEDLEALREQAAVEKIYRDAVETLFTIVIAYGDIPEGNKLLQQLVHDFPGSTEAFWIGVIEMTAEAISQDNLIPGPDTDGV
jgi:hypothetical protein